MTEQETFDIVVRGLASQGWEQSLDPEPSADGVKAYALRGAGGRKCAVGWLIPDEHYCGEELLDNYRAAFSAAGIGHNLEVLYRFQVMHDHNAHPGGMRAEFRQYADEHGLTWPLEGAEGGEM